MKNRVHLDLDITEGRPGDLVGRRQRVDEFAARVEQLGGRRIRTNAPGGADFYAVVVQDPEGNEFCLS